MIKDKTTTARSDHESYKSNEKQFDSNIYLKPQVIEPNGKIDIHPPKIEKVPMII